MIRTEFPFWRSLPSFQSWSFIYRRQFVHLLPPLKFSFLPSPKLKALGPTPNPDPSQEVFVRYGNIISLSWIQNQRLNSSYDVLFPLISLNLRRSHTLLKVNRWIGGSANEHIAEAKQSLGWTDCAWNWYLSSVENLGGKSRHHSGLVADQLPAKIAD